MENIMRMKYSQYKKHYADCSTVYGSYDKISKSIEVIIPDGRMKASGVRGRRFSGYSFRNEKTGFVQTFRAVDKEHALKQCLKGNPGTTFSDWECMNVWR